MRVAHHARPLLEDVEERILYSVDFAPAAFAANSSFAFEERQTLAPLPSLRDQNQVEIVFVDAGVPDTDMLIADLQAQRAAGRLIEIVRIGADDDGIATVSATLAGRDGIGAVHILSHGENAAVRLGNVTLDAQTLLARAGEIADWGAAFSADGDLLIYGCDLAAGADGLRLIDALSALTGADVAASNDPTGASDRGGDWLLEYRTGAIEADVALSFSGQTAWTGLLTVAAGPSSTGNAIWANSGSTLPQMSEWDGLTFSASSASASVGQWRVIQGAEAPTRDEIIVVGVNAAGTVQGEMWNGTTRTWSALPINPLGTVSETNRWGFDVAYEQSSGDAVLVWNDNTQSAGNKLRFSVWNGTSWSAAASIAAYTGSEPQQMHMVAKPGGDEMVLVVNDASSRDYALVWNGSSWGNAITLDATAGGEDDQTPLSVVYEAQSGRAMVAYGKDGNTNVFHRLWNGTSWSAEGSSGIPAGVLSQAQWVTLAADPNSDRIALGAVTNDLITATVWLAVWDGSSWGNRISATSLGSSNAPNVSVAFESRTGELLAAYGASDDSLRYRTWTASGGWSAQVTGTNFGGKPTTLILNADPNTDQIMLTAETDGKKLHGLIWNGTAWGPRTQLSNDTNETGNQPFVFLWDQGAHINTTSNALWLSPTADASSPGWTGVNSISEGEVLRFSDPNLAFSPATTAGTFSHVFNLKEFAADASADIDALHYVSRTVSLPGFTLRAGDVLFSTADNETLTANNAVAVTKEEVILFRPDTPGDYRAGTFTILLDNFGTLHGGSDTRSITLVEQSVAVGEVTLTEGTFLFSRDGGAEDDDIYRFVPTGVGVGATAGTVEVLIYGQHLSVGAKIYGLSIVSTATTIANVTLPAGAILVNLDGDDNGGVGNNLLPVKKEDVFYLQVTQTSLAGQTASATATMLVKGANVGMAGENVNALALVVTNRAPVLDASGAPTFDAIAEDALNPPGTSVAAMLATGAGGAPITDLDTGSPQGIAVTGAASANGVWQFSTTGGASWTTFGALSDASATLLNTAALIRFVPNANFNGSATLTFRAWDQFSGANGQSGVNASINGGATAFSTVSETASITVTAENDNPVLGLNAGLTLMQGATAVIDTLRLQATDVDDAAAAVTFTLTALPTYGTLRRGGVDLVLIGDTFTQQDVDSGLVDYVHDNTPNPSDSFFFTVTDALGASAGPAAEFTISVTNTNAAPTITANSLTISEGASAVPTLTATDPDNTPAQLGFAVSGVSGGRFELVSNPGVAITTFTQAQVDAGNVRFVHDGGEAAPAYSVSVSDGALGDGPQAATINFTNANDPPAISANALNVIEGGTAQPLLSVSDPDNAPAQLTWTVSGVSGGQFELVAAPGSAITTFTQAQIDANEVVFAHDGGEAAPAYSVSLSDGTDNVGPQAATISFTNVNDPPAITANALTLNEGQSVVLGASNFAASDPDNSADELTWTVSGVSGGQFELAAAPGAAVTTFTQAQIDANEVVFVHDGGEAAPAYSVSLSDGTDNVGPQAATINFTNQNDPPAISANALTLNEGQSVVLGASNFAASDPDNTPAQLTWTISGLSGGQFELVANPGVAITSFTQAQINAAAVRFVHDGGEAAPAYSVSLSDGTANVGPQAATVSFTNTNDDPVITSNGGGATAAISIAENTTAVTTVTATDADLPPQVLTYGFGGGVDDAKFTIDANSGVLSFIAAPDFEAQTDVGGDNVYDVIVEVSDGTSTATQDIAVTVLDNGMVLDRFDTVSWGNNNGTQDWTTNWQEIGEPGSPNMGVLNVSASGYARIGGDSVSIAGKGIVRQADLAGATTARLTFDYRRVDVDGGGGSVSLQVSGNGGGSWSTLQTYVLTSFDASFQSASFNISGFVAVNTQVRFLGAGTADAYFYVDNVQIEHNGTATNRAPVVTSFGGADVVPRNVAENTAPVATVTATDPEAGALMYSLVGGVDQAKFTIDANSGALSFIAVPDFEDPTDVGGDNVYDVEVRVTDPLGASDFQIFAVTVTDVNDPPAISANALTLNEGQSVVLGASNFAASDPDNTPAQLTWTISGLSGGQFELVANPGVAITSFTQAQINAAAVRFVHDGGEAAPAYSVSVSDGALGDGPQAATINFTNQNDPPAISANALTLNEGQSVVLGASNFAASDPDNTPAQLTWTVSGVSGGQFEFVAAPGVAITSFTQAQINAGDVVFVHDGGEAAPAYSVSVSDGALGAGPQAATISFTNENDAPVIAVNGGAILAEGAQTLLTSTQLQAFDPDNVSAQLMFSIAAQPTHGELRLSNVPLGIHGTFTQADIDSGRLSYAHDGSETTADAFSVTLTDGSAVIGGATFGLTITSVNDAPHVVAHPLAIGQGQSLVVSSAWIEVTDPDSPAGDLRLAVAEVRGGRFELAANPGVPVTSFTRAQIDAGEVQFVHDGSSSPPAFNLTVSDNVATIGPIAVVANAPVPVASATAASTPLPASAAVEVDVQAQPTAPSGPAAPLQKNAAVTIPDAPPPAADPTPAPTGEDLRRPAPDSGSFTDYAGLQKGFTTSLAARSADGVPEPSPLALQFASSRAPDSRFLDVSALTEALRNRETTRELNQIRNQIEEQVRHEKSVVASSIAVSTGLSIGYVLWLIRGGVLLTSVLASLPAWKTLDPLPVLGNLKPVGAADDADDSDALESMFSGTRAAPAVDAMSASAKEMTGHGARELASTATEIRA